MSLVDPVGNFDANQLKIALHDMEQRAIRAESKLDQQAIRLTAQARAADDLANEIMRLRDDLARVTRGDWSKELARLSQRNAELQSRLDEALKRIAEPEAPHKDGGIYTSKHRAWQMTSTQEKIDALFTPEQRERFWAKVQRGGSNECWLWTGPQTNHGYGQHTVRGISFRVHRMAFMLERGVIPADLHVLHACNTRLCCNPNHLDIGTVEENLRQRELNGNPAKGARHGRAKLSPDMIYEIRDADGSAAEIGKRFGIHGTTVRSIKMRKLWASLPERAVEKPPNRPGEPPLGADPTPDPELTRASETSR